MRRAPGALFRIFGPFRAVHAGRDRDRVLPVVLDLDDGSSPVRFRGVAHPRLREIRNCRTGRSDLAGIAHLVMADSEKTP